MGCDSVPAAKAERIAAELDEICEGWVRDRDVKDLRRRLLTVLQRLG